LWLASYNTVAVKLDAVELVELGREGMKEGEDAMPTWEYLHHLLSRLMPWC
jgi:hypothetical protein